MLSQWVQVLVVCLAGLRVAIDLCDTYVTHRMSDSTLTVTDGGSELSCPGGGLGLPDRRKISQNMHLTSVPYICCKGSLQKKI